MPEPDLFWRCFANVCETHDTILQLMISQMPKGASGSLRRVNRAMRAAVNRTVTTVVLNMTGPCSESDLAASFPQAEKLRVFLDSIEQITHVDVSQCLEFIVSSSPALVSKLVALEIDLGSAASDEDVTVAMASFLLRCTSLQELEVHWGDGCQVKFQGQGRTSEEQQRSMQRQLAALCSSTQFLDPTSWPACNILTSCQLPVVSDTQPLYVDAAAHTTTLVSLDVCMDHVSSFDCLSSLSSLKNLTQLDLRTEDVGDAAPCDAVLEAIGQLRNLRKLRLDESMFCCDAEEDLGAFIPASWSALQGLQRLELWYGCVSMPSLFHLTGLTSLEGTAVSEAAADEPAAGSAAVEVPQQWRDGLRHLNWSNCGRSTLPILCQLTSLSSLQIRGVRASPELCRVLSRLPVLRDLHLSAGAAPDELHFNRDTSKFRPKLPSLRICTISVATSAVTNCLNVLARWSDIPTKEPVVLGVPARTPFVIRGWGLGWVVAALASGKDLAVVLEDDDGVALYVAAVAATASGARVEGCSPTVTLALGERVTPAGFSRLLCAARLPSSALRIGGTCIEYGVPAAGLRLTSRHMQQLYGMAAPSLRVLHIDDCSMLSDRDVAVLASTAPGLRQLQLGSAAGLTDSALFALLRCSQLVSVHLGGAEKVTADGVAVVLMLLKELRELCLDGSQHGESSDVVPRVLQCMPPAAARLWAEREGVGGHSATWSKAVA